MLKKVTESIVSNCLFTMSCHRGVYSEFRYIPYYDTILLKTINP